MDKRTVEHQIIIDGLQYCAWSAKTFRQMVRGGVTSVHATIAYHENFRETVANIERWNRWFECFAEQIFHGTTAEDVLRAKAEKRTAIFFGLQNCSSIEDDIGLIEVCHRLGIRFMQLSYNNQSVLATGCYEAEDPGITRMGREVIREMNRVGLVIDMSHSAERSTLEAISISERPIAITHANPKSWHPSIRNKSDVVLQALAESDGMLGLSLFPHHLAGSSACSLQDFCTMAARTVELMGIDHVGIGSDLCQDQPDSVVNWMRSGRWSKTEQIGAGPTAGSGFPPQPSWFKSNLGFANLGKGLKDVGFSGVEVAKILGLNWLRFFEASFGPMQRGNMARARSEVTE